jgi:hypothetical protein
MHQLIPAERIESKILLVREQKVMLDRDLAELYRVTTKQLNQAVTRNLDRFPPDFMFSLTDEEFENLRSQFVTAKWSKVRFPPRAFTEQGVAMLSSVLRSKRAVQVNILIMRAFVKMREVLTSHKELARKIDDMEKKYDVQFKVVFDAIKRLMAPPSPASSPRYGFHIEKNPNDGSRTKTRMK